MAQITTHGSGKGAVSLATQAANAAKAAQANLTVAKLKIANDNLKSQLSSPQTALYIGGLQQQYTDVMTRIPYVQETIASSKWQGNANYNSDIVYYAQISPSSTHVGVTISSAELVKINTYLGTLTTQAASLAKQIKTIQDTIQENTKKISALTAGTTPGNGTNTTNSKGKGSKAPPPSADPSAVQPAPEFWDSSYEWNLPPHMWSLPVDPYDLAPNILNKRTDSIHSTRRGRIWFFNGYVGPTNQLDYTTGTYAQDKSGNAIPGKTIANKYGFQFIWNPETYSQSTAVNMNVTPSSTDPTIALTGFAAANSTINFTLRLDRTNDFTCAKAYLDPNNGSPNITLPTNNAELTSYDATTAFAIADLNALSLEKFYTQGQPLNTTNGDLMLSTADKIVNLLTYGTEADLEYLYRVINGDGWTGIGSRVTSNMGYLMPSLIRIDLGQQKFVGVVSSVGVNHLAFTRDLVPIRTDVDISVDLRANIQYSTNG